MKRTTIALALVSTVVLAGCDHKKSKSKPNPTGPTLAQSSTSHLWAARIIRTGSACSVFYDFRREKSFDFHVLCMANDNKTIKMESYEYSSVPVQGGWNAKLITSSCPGAAPNFTYKLAVTNQDQSELPRLVMSSGGEITNLDFVPEDMLIEDLRTATSLHGRPLVRGCFSTNLDRTSAQGTAQ